MDWDKYGTGKQRSHSQRVGTKGENGFRFFCEGVGLVPTRVEEDFGIDFFCQVDLGASGTTGNIANTFIGAFVRATESQKRTVKLTRKDAMFLLTNRAPLVFMLVHILEDGTREFFHRIVDVEFAKELAKFLVSTKPAEHKIAADTCLPATEFPHSLSKLLEPGFTEKTHLSLAEMQIGEVVPGVSIEVRKKTTGQLTQVTAVNFFDFFDTSSEEAELEVLHAAFGAQELALERIAQLATKPEIAPMLGLLPRPPVLAGFSEEYDAVLRVSGDEVPDLPVTVRSIGAHTGVVHESGFSLVISKALLHEDGKKYHTTAVVFDPLVERPLEDLPVDVRAFFAACREDSLINFGPDEDSLGSRGLQVGEHLPGLLMGAAFVDAWDVCREFPGWPSNTVHLRDAGDGEVFNTIVALATLNREPAALRQWSFALESPKGPGVDYAKLPAFGVTAKVPLVANLSSTTIVAYLEAEAEVLGDLAEPTGVRFLRTTGISVEELGTTVPKQTVHPEILVGAGYPTITLDKSEGAVYEDLQHISLSWTVED